MEKGKRTIPRIQVNRENTLISSETLIKFNWMLSIFFIDTNR